MYSSIHHPCIHASINPSMSAPIPSFIHRCFVHFWGDGRWVIDPLIQWLSSSLIYWLAAPLTHRSFGSVTGSLIHWFVAWLIQCFLVHGIIDSLIHWFCSFTGSVIHHQAFIDRLIQWLADSWNHWLIGSLFTNSLLHWLNDSLLHGSLTRKLTDSLMQQLIDWFVNSVVIDSRIRWTIESVHGILHVMSLASQPPCVIRWCTSQIQHFRASTSQKLSYKPLTSDRWFKLFETFAPAAAGHWYEWRMGLPGSGIWKMMRVVVWTWSTSVHHQNQGAPWHFRWLWVKTL